MTKQILRLHIRWIRGHSGDVGNGIADRLADEGTRRELQHRWWRRCPLSVGWDEEGFIKKVVSIQRETTVDGLVQRISQNGYCVAQARSGTGDTRNCHRHISHCMESREAWESRPQKNHDPMWPEVRRLGVERRCEKDPMKTRQLFFALNRARSLMRRKQTVLNFKKAVEAGAPPRLQGPPPPTRPPILEKLGADGTTERVEDFGGCTSIVHQHFMELFTDPMQKEIPEWMWRRWPQ